MADPFPIIISLAVFSVIMLIISVFLLIQVIKAEKEARPFLISLFLYFLIMTIANLIQMLIYLIDPSSLIGEFTGLYNDYFVICLTLFAPLPLIYQIERTYFPEQKLFGKYHLIALFILILNIIFLAITIPLIITVPGFLETFTLMSHVVLIAVNWAVIVLSICVAFLYLGLKSAGRYRLYSFIIFLTWGANQASNAVLHLLPYTEPLLIAIFIVKVIGAILTAFAFIKLYTLKG